MAAPLKAMRADETIVGRWRNYGKSAVLVESERGYRLLQRDMFSDKPREYREVLIRDISVERGPRMYTHRPELEDVEHYVAANGMRKA